MTDEQPQKPPSLPGTDDDRPSAHIEIEEPPREAGDTEPTGAASDTQPKRPTLIPGPPGRAIPPQTGPRRRRRRRRKGGWWGALGIALLLSLVVALVFVVLFVAFAPSEYVDPWIPGRVATRTQEARLAQATADVLATRDAEFVQAATQAAQDVAATGTAVVARENARATRDALSLIGTQSAIEGTATASALGFDATRTAVALEAQNAAAEATLDTLRLQFTQTAIADNARATAVHATLSAAGTANAAARFVPTPAPRLADGGTQPLPTVVNSSYATFFSDDFEGDLKAGWTVGGAWRTAGGRALSNVCGSVLLVGNRDWENYALEVDVDSPGAQFALFVGYGDAGRLYVNFGLGGALWWLVEGADLIDTQITAGVFDPDRVNRIRLEARGRVVAVYVNGFLVAERLLPARTSGPAGLYTCPANAVIPTFDNVRLMRLADD